MLQNPNFPGLCPGPDGGAYSALLDLLADGEGLAAPPKNPITALGTLGLISTGLRV